MMKENRLWIGAAKVRITLDYATQIAGWPKMDK